VLCNRPERAAGAVGLSCVLWIVVLVIVNYRFHQETEFITTVGSGESAVDTNAGIALEKGTANTNLFIGIEITKARGKC
jgi:hypothetical protein